jgi:hypothetical protein
MRSEHYLRLREMHWLNHADHYLSLVREALQKNPQDAELRELMEAMEAAMVVRERRPLH